MLIGIFDLMFILLFDCQSVMLTLVRSTVSRKCFPWYVSTSGGNAYLGMFDYQLVMLTLVCSTVSR